MVSVGPVFVATAVVVLLSCCPVYGIHGVWRQHFYCFGYL
jgi:hypothetical protein